MWSPLSRFLSVIIVLSVFILIIASVRRAVRLTSKAAWPSDTECPKIGAESAGKWLCFNRSDRSYLDLRTGAWNDCRRKGDVPAPSWCPRTMTITLGSPEVQSVETDDAGVTRIRFEATTTSTYNR